MKALATSTPPEFLTGEDKRWSMKICKQGHEFDRYCKICKAAYYEANKIKILDRIKSAHHENKDRQNAKSRAHYAANAEKFKALAKKNRQENAEVVAATKRKYRAANIEKIKAYKAANKERDDAARQQWEEANKVKRQAQYKAYREANRDKRNAQSREYCAANPGVMLAKVRKRQAAKNCRRPAWCCDKDCKAIYKEARRLGLTVDHIVPLQGEFVSGLHWAHNLQLLPAAVNFSKSNKFDPDTYVHELPLY
jgi:hypothetical protein